MAPTASLLLLLLRVVISSLVSSPGWTLLSDWDQTTSAAPLEPHFTDCVSRDQETFRCWWSPGIFHNLSLPGDLRVFYLKSPSSEWKECPEYILPNRECFFDKNHTNIWIQYCMQLRSHNASYFNQNNCFNVENIVRPDPPVSLNWTLLNVSPSGLSYDVVINWEPPPTADVRTGWMRLEYEIQYREKNTTNWEALDVQPQTKQAIFGLHIGKEYDVHIRCKMQGFTKYGDFSDSIFIQVTDIMTEEPPLLFILVLVLGIIGVLILIMLIAITQQHRLMMILLPPVPAPKIKGIDSDLLKKGKLDNLNFFLNGGGFGALPPYTPELFHDEPWVEFIEVEAEERDAGDKDDSLTSDTQMLLGLTQTGCHHMNVGCSNSVSFPDKNSGQSSCYDPALLEADSLMLMGSLLPGQPEDEEEEEEAASFNNNKRCPTSAEGGEIKHNPVQPTWINTDFYAQVSNVMPSGGVVLSPGQHIRTQESSSTTEEEKQKKEHFIETEEKTQTKLLVMDPEGCTVENITPPPPISSVSPGEYQTVEPSPVSPSHGNQSANIIPDPSQCQIFTPVADYTVVQELDSNRSLILQPPPPAPQPPMPSCLPLKVPMGYITPDLLGSLSP